MIIAHYDHRLPADYDLAMIRDRARRRGAIWDDVPELYFKAFLLRERGKFGANANNYSSLYLWRHDEVFADFLKTGRYRTVTDSFGRADIRTRFGLDARRGAASTAELAILDERSIPLDADLNESLAAAVALNREVAAEPETVAAIVGIDTQSWTLLHITLLRGKAQANRPGTCYQILHLAQPLLATLPRSEA
jgi:hypothetical protein